MSEAVAFDWDEPALWAPDLVVGWVFLGSGMLAWSARRNRGTAALLVATGLAWFLGLSGATLYLHRGPLTHLIVAFAGWRARSRLSTVAIWMGYLAAVLPGVWRNEALATALALGLVVVTVTEFARTRGRASRDRLTAVQASAILGGVVIAGAVARLAVGASAVVPSLLAYELSLCGIAIGLLVRLRTPDVDAITNLVVELPERRTGPLRDRLAEVLSDPSLVVGYWSPDAGAYLTEDGVVVGIPAAGSGAAATFVGRDNSRLAVLIHDELVLRDRALIDSVARATRLASSHVELQARLNHQLEELSASRRRLLAVADEERGRLELRLRQGPIRQLADLDEVLLIALDGVPQATEGLRRARELARRASEDLGVLCLGLHPRSLVDSGLPAALGSLAALMPCPTVVEVDDQALPQVQLHPTIYYVCAEALANVSKHAQASEARVDVARRDDLVAVTVTDDGIGGASLSGGTGLQGLADRVHAAGGTLRVDSPLEMGTSVHVTLPVPHDEPAEARQATGAPSATPGRVGGETMAGTSPPTDGTPFGASVPGFAGGARNLMAGRLLAVLSASGYAVLSAALLLTIRMPTTYPAASVPATAVALTAGVGLVAVGSIVTLARPQGHVGLIVLALGMVWLAPVWVGWDGGPATIRSTAMLVAPFLLALLVHLALAFPVGRLRTRLERVATNSVYLVTVAYSLGRAAVRDPFRDLHCWSNCSDNVFLVAADPGVARALDRAWLWATAAIGLALAAEVARRLRTTTRVGRRTGSPVLVPIALAAVAEASYAAALLLEPAEDPEKPLFAVVFLLRAASLTALAVGLGWALWREQRTRRSLSGLAAELGEAPEAGKLSARLARALDDPNLHVAYWLPESARFVDADGRERQEPDPEVGSRTPILRNGRLVAVVTHDPVVGRSRDLQDEIGAATALAIDNERLRAGVLAQVEDLRASRARVVEASDSARQQLERDLHDGAQQLLLALSYELRLARDAAQRRGDPALAGVLAGACGLAVAAVEQLRVIAHGIYPAVLTTAGLGAAVHALADDAPVPVEVRRVPDRRFPTRIERAVYVVVARLVDQAAGSGADHVEVDVADLGTTIRLRAAPVGLTADMYVRDRVADVGGQLTLIRDMLCAEVPCE